MELYNQLNTSVDLEIEDIDKITAMADLLGMLTVNEMYEVVGRWIKKENEWASQYGGKTTKVTDAACAKEINRLRPFIMKYQSI